jgi:hypothetical protein
MTARQSSHESVIVFMLEFPVTTHTPCSFPWWQQQSSSKCVPRMSSSAHVDARCPPYAASQDRSKQPRMTWGMACPPMEGRQMDSTPFGGIRRQLGSSLTWHLARRGSQDRIRRSGLSGVLALLLAAASLLVVAGSAPVALAGKPYFTCSRTDRAGTRKPGGTSAPASRRRSGRRPPRSRATGRLSAGASTRNPRRSEERAQRGDCGPRHRPVGRAASRNDESGPERKPRWMDSGLTN